MINASPKFSFMPAFLEFMITHLEKHSPKNKGCLKRDNPLLYSSINSSKQLSAKCHTPYRHSFVFFSASVLVSS